MKTRIYCDMSYDYIFHQVRWKVRHKQIVIENMDGFVCNHEIFLSNDEEYQIIAQNKNILYTGGSSMKTKIITKAIMSFALLIAVVAGSAPTAEAAGYSKSWNFKNSSFKSLGKITQTVSVDGLDLYATSNKPMEVKANQQSLDGTTYKYCLTLQGMGNNTYRSVRVPVDNGSKIKIILMSSGSSTRKLNVAEENGTILTTMSAGSKISKGEYTYNGSSNYLYVYSSNSGINLFKIQVDYTGTEDTSNSGNQTPGSNTNTNTGNTNNNNPTTAPNNQTGIPSGYTVVASDGSGSYRTLQSAINAGKKNIYVKAGTYKEVVTIGSSLKGIHIVGENANNTIFTYDNYSGKSKGNGGTYGTGGSASFFVYGSNITIENITISNSFKEQGNQNEQAVALYASGKVNTFKNCSITGNQDTLCLYGGTQYFETCYIAGDVDFIFGNSQAYFEQCEICSLNRGSNSNNGYITAASTLATANYGFVFHNCNLTCASGTAKKSVHLGRPWCPNGSNVNKGAVAFINCTMGAHIKDAPWTSMSGVSASHGRFYEYKSTGKGAVVNNSRPQLSDWNAAQYTKQNVLGW